MLALALLLIAQDSARPTVLEPVTVQGIRQSAPPLARTTLLAADLGGLRAGAFLDEALPRAAGVVAQFRGTFALDTRLVIRGAGARSAFGVRGVTVLLDGVPQTLPDGQAGLSQVDIASLARVDIVRGAAGAFYGNGAGGVLLLTSASALGRPAAVRARATAGSYGGSTLSAAASTPLGAGAATVSLSRIAQDGFRDYSAGELRQAGAVLEWPAGARTRLRARLRVADLARAENPGALDSAQLAANPRQANARNVAFAAGEEAREWQASLDAVRAVSGGEVSAALFGISRDLDNPLASSWVVLDRTDGGARLAGRWQLGGRRAVELQLGAEAQRQRDDRRNYSNDSGRMGATPTLDQRETVTSLGARAGLAASLPARIGARVGVRLDRVTFSVTDDLLSDGDASARREMGAASFTASLERRLGRWRAWASAGTAFETPTTTELARPGTGGFNPDLGPQRTLQGELGVEWVMPRTRVSLATYRSRVRDALVQREEPAQPGRFYFENAARVRLAGVEAEASASPAPWLSLAGSLTITRHRYVSFPTDSTPLDGRLVPGLPGSAAYALASLGRSLGPQLEVEVLAQGRVWADDANTASAPAATQLHARAGWRAHRVTLFGGVRNVTNAKVVGSVNVNGALRRFFEPAPGRTWYAGLEASR